MKVTESTKELYEDSGIKAGYILLEVNGKKVQSAQALKDFVDKYGEDQIRTLAFINTKGQYERFIFR